MIRRTLHRHPPRAPVPTGRCRVGFGVRDFTPDRGVAMAGYSTDGHRARGATGRLRARAMALEDAEGRRAAVCVLDLMTASRYLLESVACLVAVQTGISRERLVLVGTHTHTGPGHFFGASLYDHLAQNRSGFRPGLADGIARAAADAIGAAFEASRPARLGVATRDLWGVTRQASPRAFLANPEARAWMERAPDGLSDRQRQVDPELTVLVATDVDGVFGSLAVFAGHATALGSGHRSYDPDWNGVACARAAGELGHTMLAPGAGADLNVLRDGEKQGPDLAALVGRTVGEAWVETAREAAANTADFEVDIRFGTAPDPTLDACPLADTPVFGVATLGGADDGRTILFGLRGLAPSTSNAFPPTHPQFPKAPALGVLQEGYAHIRHLALPPELPLHVLRVGGLTLATVPGEPSVLVGHRIARALAEPGQHVRVVGYAGAYVGYVTTAEEYAVQEYEGASALLGRFTAKHLQICLSHVASEPPCAPADGAAEFESVG